MQPRNKLNNAIFLKRVLHSNFRRPSFPYKLTFAVTYHCNLKCKTCLIWSKEPSEELGIDEIGCFFRKSNGFSWVDLTGGEIFLRPDLLEIVDLIVRNCRSLAILHFPTNGQLADKIVSVAEKIRRMKGAVPVITVSIDGPEDVHNRIRGSNDSWKKAVEAFCALKKSDFRHVYIGYTISQHNIGKIDEAYSAIKNIYRDLTFDDIHVNFFHTSQHYLNNTSSGFPSEDSIRAEYEGLQRKRRKGSLKGILEEQYFSLIPQYLSSKKMPIKCQALRTTLFMDPYGDIYPCSIYSKRIANIRDVGYDLKKLWNSKDMTADALNDILYQKCDGCWTPCEAYPSLLGSLPRCLKSAVKR